MVQFLLWAGIAFSPKHVDLLWDLACFLVKGHWLLFVQEQSSQGMKLTTSM
jgi:hypothetical protein